MPKIFSLIIPIFNSELTLSECLDSVVSQITEDIEILCINDGSTDSSLEILKKYSYSYSNLKIFSKSNGGLSSARNYGLEQAEGKYIGFLDSDDLIREDFFKKLINILQEDECDLVCCGTEVKYYAWPELKKSDDLYFYICNGRKLKVIPDHFTKINVAAWNKAYKREIINNNNIRFPNGLWYEDAAFYWIYLSYCDSISFIPEKLYIYNRYPSSIMAQTFSRSSLKVLDHIRVSEIVYEHLRIKNKIKDLQHQFLKFYISNVIQTWRYIPKNHRMKGVVFFINTFLKMKEVSLIHFLVTYLYLKMKK